MLPVLKLGGTNIERAPFDAAETHVLAADPKLSHGVAHRRAAVAAAAGLMEHKVAMGVPQSGMSLAAASVIMIRSTIGYPRLKGRGRPVDEYASEAACQKKPIAFGL